MKHIQSPIGGVSEVATDCDGAVTVCEAEAEAAAQDRDLPVVRCGNGKCLIPNCGCLQYQLWEYACMCGHSSADHAD